MKIFIYYSNTGNGELVKAEFEKMGYDIRKVVPKKDLPKKFFFKVMTGGMLAGLNHKSKLLNFNYDVSAYDEVVIGSPVWNGKLSCPINTVLKNIKLENKKVRFVLYSGSGTSPKAEGKIHKLFGEETEIIQLQEPKKYPDNLKKLSE